MYMNPSILNTHYKKSLGLNQIKTQTRIGNERIRRGSFLMIFIQFSFNGKVFLLYGYRAIIEVFGMSAH
jgi:hypothetical protein